ncbi:LIC10729 family protein, partial [Leptospira interrogans]
MVWHRLILVLFCFTFTNTWFLQSKENPKFKKFINFDHQ